MNCITQLQYTLFSEPALLVGHLGLEQDVSPVSHPLLKSLQFLAGPVMRVAAAAVAAVRLRRNCGARLPQIPNPVGCWHLCLALIMFFRRLLIVQI